MQWILGNILESSTRDPVGGSVCFRRALKTWKASTVVDEKDTAGVWARVSSLVSSLGYHSLLST
jgi:hypothetical protein